VTGTEAGVDAVRRVDSRRSDAPGEPDSEPSSAGSDGPRASDGEPGGVGDRACGAHAGVGAELRALALTALDRLEPVLQRLGAEQPAAPTAGPCAGCPVCALLAVLRGERPELAVTLAEQLGGLLAVLRTALEEGDPTATRPAAEPPTAPKPSERRVQRIPVERVAR
jgi:hypothetical protein